MAPRSGTGPRTVPASTASMVSAGARADADDSVGAGGIGAGPSSLCHHRTTLVPGLILKRPRPYWVLTSHPSRPQITGAETAMWFGRHRTSRPSLPSAPRVHATMAVTNGGPGLGNGLRLPGRHNSAAVGAAHIRIYGPPECQRSGSGGGPGRSRSRTTTRRRSSWPISAGRRPIRSRRPAATDDIPEALSPRSTTNCVSSVPTISCGKGCAVELPERPISRPRVVRVPQASRASQRPAGARARGRGPLADAPDRCLRTDRAWRCGRSPHGWVQHSCGTSRQSRRTST